tara:strand:+ start:87 stop:251 length:165 start_codon:yes stop_codon:yes gene_type:complete
MVVISMQNRFPNPIPYSFGKWEKPKKVICIASEIRKSLEESDQKELHKLFWKRA